MIFPAIKDAKKLQEISKISWDYCFALGVKIDRVRRKTNKSSVDGASGGGGGGGGGGEDNKIRNFLIFLRNSKKIPALIGLL